MAGEPIAILGMCYADALDRDDLPDDAVMYRVEGTFRVGGLSQQRVQQRWVEQAEVQRAMVEDAECSGDESEFQAAVMRCWRGPW